MNRTPASEADRERVRTLLGREPRGEYAIVVRDVDGDPVVLQNAPLLDDGTPMPTRFWLVGPEQHRIIGRLESAGGVNAAEAAIDPDVLADAHRRYAEERDRELPPDYDGPLPSGGVGGTRIGVKCLHAHWAWYLAGGDDPVGAWIAEQLSVVEPSRSDQSQSISLAPTSSTVTLSSDVTITVPWGPQNLTERWLRDTDPPNPADLTNALGTIDDELDDIVRTNPWWKPDERLTFVGPGITALIGLELGHEVDGAIEAMPIERATVEELFRLTATVPDSERAFNPGLPADHVADIVGVCCIVLAVMRRFQLAQAHFAIDHHSMPSSSSPSSPSTSSTSSPSSTAASGARPSRQATP